MAFKLGGENRGKTYGGGGNRFQKDDASVPGTPVIRKDLAPGIEAEANMDGSIFISNNVEPNSEAERKILQHEMKHIVDMKTGKLAYTDDKITWMGQDHTRKKGHIEYEGEWHAEGDPNLPWEKH
tara:strand:- start:352 stop:726 length:375 start_codon:yes stop_codon:yes gene_type:complete